MYIVQVRPFCFTQRKTLMMVITHMFIATMKHKPDRKYKVQRSAGLKQEWKQMQCRGRVGLTCPVSSGLPPPSLSWRLLIQFVGTSNPAEGKFYLVLAGSYGVYGAQSIGIILLWMGRAPKLWHHLAIKLNQTLTDKTFFIHIFPPNPKKTFFFFFTCHCTLYIYQNIYHISQLQSQLLWQAIHE